MTRISRRRPPSSLVVGVQGQRCVVAGGQDEAAEILARIRNSGFGATGNAFAGGFTDYVLSRDAKRFFRDQAGAS